MKINTSAYQRHDKMAKTTISLRNRELAKHIPATFRYTQEKLVRMLKSYGMVYVKPVQGSRGIGVLRVEHTRQGYRCQAGTAVHHFRTSRQLHTWLRSQIGSRPYLVQRGIHMLRYNKRPFDFRVMIQRNLRNSWEVTGVAARLAHPAKIVTNGSQGGTIYSAAQLLGRTAGQKKASGLIGRMKRISHQSARQLSGSFRGLHELGVDIAIDQQHRLWVLEINTRPDPCPFTLLSDKSMINRMIRYAQRYGRTYNLLCKKARRAPK